MNKPKYKEGDKDKWYWHCPTEGCQGKANYVPVRCPKCARLNRTDVDDWDEERWQDFYADGWSY